MPVRIIETTLENLQKKVIGLLPSGEEASVPNAVPTIDEDIWTFTSAVDKAIDHRAILGMIVNFFENPKVLEGHKVRLTRIIPALVKSLSPQPMMPDKLDEHALPQEKIKSTIKFFKEILEDGIVFKDSHKFTPHSPSTILGSIGSFSGATQPSSNKYTTASPTASSTRSNGFASSQDLDSSIRSLNTDSKPPAGGGGVCVIL